MLLFQGQKRKFPKNITLPYFNPNSSTTLQTNASKKGLGAVLLQNSKPVMFASRALTGSERNYQNLERECLATIWGMEKFHYFLYGKEFTLKTDQKPLVSIYRVVGFMLRFRLKFQIQFWWNHYLSTRIIYIHGKFCSVER